MRRIDTFTNKRMNSMPAMCLIVIASLSACASPVIDVRAKFSAGEALDEAVKSYYARGKSNLDDGRYGLALENFGMALSRKPLSVEILNAVAASYDRLGRYNLAMRYYRKALRLDPGSVQTNNNIGYSYYLRGEVELAASILVKISGSAGAGSVVRGNFRLARLAAMKARRLECRSTDESEADASVEPRSDGLRSHRKFRIVPIGSRVQRLVMESDRPSRSAAIASGKATAFTRSPEPVRSPLSTANSGHAAMGHGSCAPGGGPKIRSDEAPEMNAPTVSSPVETGRRVATIPPAGSRAAPARTGGFEVRFDNMPELFELEPELIGPIGSEQKNESI